LSAHAVRSRGVSAAGVIESSWVCSVASRSERFGLPDLLVDEQLLVVESANPTASPFLPSTWMYCRSSAW
jgi:hypothetical protein